MPETERLHDGMGTRLVVGLPLSTLGKWIDTAKALSDFFAIWNPVGFLFEWYVEKVLGLSKV